MFNPRTCDVEEHGRCGAGGAHAPPRAAWRNQGARRGVCGVGAGEFRVYSSLHTANDQDTVALQATPGEQLCVAVWRNWRRKLQATISSSKRGCSIERVAATVRGAQRAPRRSPRNAPQQEAGSIILPPQFEAGASRAAATASRRSLLFQSVRHGAGYQRHVDFRTEWNRKAILRSSTLASKASPRASHLALWIGP